MLPIPNHANRTINALIEELSRSPLGCTGVVAIGSVTIRELWDPGKSDIDLCIFIDPHWDTQLASAAKLLAGWVTSARLDVIVYPYVIIDLENPRIEAFVHSDGIVFDLTWLSGICRVGSTPYEVRHDNLELYLGNVFAYGVCLRGNARIPDNFGAVLPYYSEDLVRRRLEILERDFRSASMELERMVACNSGEVLTQLDAVQRTFLRLLFMLSRRYPLSYEKHIHYQLEHFLGLDCSTIHALFPQLVEGKLDLRQLLRAWVEYLNEITSAGKDHQV
jgi:hypothetical protein